MSKVTAMQELIEKLERYKSNAEEQAKSFDRQNMVTAEMASESMVTAYGVAILAATQLLELEKQQIVKAYTNGQKVMVDIVSERFKDAFPKTSESINKVLNDEDDNEDAEQYFTQTFTQNQQQ